MIDKRMTNRVTISENIQKNILTVRYRYIALRQGLQ